VSRSITVRAPAKVNFRLDVLRKRPDGYHDLRMIMQRIDLCAEISITLDDNSGIRLSCDGSPYITADQKNLVWRAADALLKATGRDVGVRIGLKKNIPVAAGLGGGSSDAAATLMGLNDLLELGLSSARLQEIALPIGADVPFFIFGKPAFAEGVGERLTPVEAMPKLWLLLVNPGIHISTAWAYQNLNLTTEKVAAKLPVLYKSAGDLCAILSNDLETVAMRRYPLIRELKEQIVANGAAGALMSGSGSSVFGIFTEESVARQALQSLPADSGWFMAVVPTI
jgi:4-diphosphocytidyl-2-C-methyl-D-erythritol kinase